MNYRRLFTESSDTNPENFLKELSRNSDFYQRGVGFFLSDYPNTIIDAEIFDGKIRFNIVVDERARGKGEASSAMEWFTQLADNYGITLTAVVSPFGTGIRMNKSQLLSWYQKFGFKQKRGDIIERIPRYKM